MATGQPVTHGLIVCPPCGTVYRLRSQSRRQAERDKLQCVKCDHVLKEYRAARSYWLEPRDPTAAGR